MLFDQIGIYGWDEIEPLILATALSDLSMLFIGDIGSNKTEGSKVIAKALLKPNIEFRNYEVPTLNFDDLIGFINPKNLAKGALEFIPTPLSIWQADAVLFDEINRANPFIQSKLHELIRTRTLMGLPTKLKMVFSAVNPPERYQSGYMDIALASRFVCVQVPNITVMKERHINRILSANGHKPKVYDLKVLMKKAFGAQFTAEDENRVCQMCRKIMQEVSDKEVLFNARQLKMMKKLIRSGLALRYASGMDMFADSDAVTSYVSSVIPEIHGVVRTKTNQGMILGTIRSIVSGFTLGDPVTLAQNIEELCDVEITDTLAWVSAMKQLADAEENITTLKKAIAQVKTMAGKEVIEKELAEKLARHLATNITLKTILKEETPVTKLLDRANQLAVNI